MEPQNLKLLIKKENSKMIIFTVVDSQKPPYPLNFVSVLPKYRNGLLKGNQYAQIFKDVDRIVFARSLLEAAKIEYSTDVDILAEIDARLKLLIVEAIPEKKCRNCSKPFQPKHHKTRYCESCQTAYRAKFQEFKPLKLPKPPKQKAFWVSKSVREAFKNGAFENE